LLNPTVKPYHRDRLLIRAKTIRNLKIGFSRDRDWLEYRHHLAESCELLAINKFTEAATELKLALKTKENSEFKGTLDLIFETLSDIRSRC